MYVYVRVSSGYGKNIPGRMFICFLCAVRSILFSKGRRCLVGFAYMVARYCTGVVSIR